MLFFVSLYNREPHDISENKISQKRAGGFGIFSLIGHKRDQRSGLVRVGQGWSGLVRVGTVAT